MKKFLRPIVLPLFIFLGLVASTGNVSAQCTATLNWDVVEYLMNAGNYSGYISTTLQNSQRFAIGTNAVQITAGTGVTVVGGNTNQTADAGVDIEYSSNSGVITLTFDSEVSNLSFAVYDIDRRQTLAINGKNAANANVTTVVTKRNIASTIFSLSPVTGIGTTVTATAGNSSSFEVADNSNNGTIDVDIAGPVKTVTLTIGNTGSTPTSPEIYLGDIDACIGTPFPSQYYQVSKPFSGQPGYVLTVVNNNVYYTSTSTGVSKLLFTDPGHPYINSLAYDPYNRFVYYTYSLSSSNPQNDKKLLRYDCNTKTISTILSDVTTIGVPTFDYGVESGSACFYNGSLFLGIEGYASSFDKGRKSMVWRIDFNGSNVPYRASQVYASLADDGSGNIKHDWSDIGATNGILYDFDGASGDEDYYVFNMRTGALSNYNPVNSSSVGRQVAIGWDDKVYNVDGNIIQYNGTNGFTGSALAITSTPAIPGGGSWGDAAEAFRPFVDYGDAPASYDPTAGDPAVHDSVNLNLRIGANINIEGAKRGVTGIDDVYDDGIASVPFLPAGVGSYVAQVSVFNNTGSNAILCAWLDYNGNGTFETGEGISQVVANSASLQTKYLYWPSISNSLTNGTVTYLRVRITSTGMTTANPTGYYANGEVEDYRVRVDNFPLSVTMSSFNATVINNKSVKLAWSANEDAGFNVYDIERSTDGTSWNHFAFVNGKGVGNHSYELIDPLPYRGVSYYRIKLGYDNGSARYSVIRAVTINTLDANVRITPNPATDRVMIYIYHDENVPGEGNIQVLNMQGEVLYTQKSVIRQGENPVQLPLSAQWPAGMYLVRIQTGEEVTNKKLVIKH